MFVKILTISQCISPNAISQKGSEVFVVKVTTEYYLMSLQKCGKSAKQVEQRNKQRFGA